MPELAAQQGQLIDHCAAYTRATRIYFCPSYYSDDPVLDRVFGQRPADYLSDLGRHLDPAVRVYWTGEEVCSKEIGVGHLRRVAGELGRPVCLWDNYPVNDGVRLSQHLHLRGFTGRPAAIRSRIIDHAINPAIQPLLSCIPAMTLAASYAQGQRYGYMHAFTDAATSLLGAEFAGYLLQDIALLQDVGHDRLGARQETLRQRYAAIDHPAAREIVGWLDGNDIMTIDDVKTQ